MMSPFVNVLTLVTVLMVTTPVQAETILTISGNSADEGPEQVEEFDLARLKSLGEKTLRTKITSLSGEHDLTGPLARDVLQQVKFRGTKAIATALDGYIVEIPLQDFTKYDVIIATELDGKVLTVRSKGPLWLVYPVSQHPELDDPVTEAKSVWQLDALKVE